MKHKYSIQGMTCENCVQKITQALLSVDQITEVSVDLKANSAMISMNDHVPTPVMQQALSSIGDYTIGMDMDAMTSNIKKKSVKDFIPLIVIFGIIVLFTALMSVFVGPGDIGFTMRMMMGGFFAIFGAFKLIKIKKFAEAYQTYDILAKRSLVYAYVYPFIELALAALYLFDVGGIFRDIVTAVIMSIGALGVLQKLREGEEIPCACLGMVFILPMTWVTLVEDVLMAVMALVMVLMHIL